MVAYAFPYDILNANEVRDLLPSCVGSTATTTGRVPGPKYNPTRVDDRRAALQWLDENPEHIINAQEQRDKDTSVRDTVLSGVVPKSLLKSL